MANVAFHGICGSCQCLLGEGVSGSLSLRKAASPAMGLLETLPAISPAETRAAPCWAALPDAGPRIRWWKQPLGPTHTPQCHSDPPHPCPVPPPPSSPPLWLHLPVASTSGGGGSSPFSQCWGQALRSTSPPPALPSPTVTLSGLNGWQCHRIGPWVCCFCWVSASS